MSVLRVEGGRRLEGVITVEGNKNAALPLIVASLLTTEAVTLHNVPRIRDVDVLLDLLEGLGSTV
jgi:UDP-N-acetylglucosamine 1-carboxyvinyltransferase